jgi:hypothetical protein
VGLLGLLCGNGPVLGAERHYGKHEHPSTIDTSPHKPSLPTPVDMPFPISYIITRTLETYTPSSAILAAFSLCSPRHLLPLPNVHQYRSAVLLHAPRKRLKRFPLLSCKSAIAIP